MNATSPQRSAGFSLIEVLISSALAMAMAALAVQAFLQIRKAIDRAEARIAMHASAQSIYIALRNSLASAQQSCAVVAIATQSDGTGKATDPGELSLTFMRAKENAEDYATWRVPNSHLVWERWSWKRGTRTISAATSRTVARSSSEAAVREFTIASTFIPDAGSGVSFKDKTFRNLPQPRRYLTPADPTAAFDPAKPGQSTLDDNIYFPSATDRRVSQVSPEDIGDYTDLNRASMPVLDQVSDLSLQIVPHDESLSATDVSDASTATTVWQGVWLDGRLAPTLDAAQVFAGSDASKRPKLLRLRFTMTDEVRGISQTFSFSFAWPGLAPPP